MKITFLNEALTHARIERRAWPRFWVRVSAEVELVNRHPPPEFAWDGSWRYGGTGAPVEGKWCLGWSGLQGRLFWEREYELKQREAAANRQRVLALEAARKGAWSEVRPTALPSARVVGFLSPGGRR